MFASTIINDDVEYILTFKNNALTEKMISGKLIVNNKTKNTRDVFVYKNKTLSLTNNNGNIKVSSDDKLENVIISHIYPDKQKSVETIGTVDDKELIYSFIQK